jgi:hypothetical protein
MARRGGRIRTHERNTNDDIDILGADLNVHEEHSIASVRPTDAKEINQNVEKNYRNRLMQDAFYHKNTHGLVYTGRGVRKGSATQASAGTTCPPPVSLIAARGEWSMGKVLDVYYHHATTTP